MFLADKKTRRSFISFRVGTVDPDKVELRIEIRHEHVGVREHRLQQLVGLRQRFLSPYDARHRVDARQEFSIGKRSHNVPICSRLESCNLVL